MDINDALLAAPVMETGGSKNRTDPNAFARLRPARIADFPVTSQFLTLPC